MRCFYQTVILDLLCTLLQYTKLFMAFYYLQEKRCNRKAVAGLYSVGIVLCFILGGWDISLQGEIFFYTGILLWKLFCTLLDREMVHRMTFQTISNYLLICASDGLFQFLLGEKYTKNSICFLAEGVIATSFALFIYLSNRYRKQSDIRTEDGKAEPLERTLGILSAVAFLSLLLLSFERQYQYFGNQQKAQRTGIVLIAAFILMDVILINRQIYVSHLLNESELERKIFHAEKNYYESLLSRENRTKKFRHDLRSHLVAMSAMARAGQHQELTDYINDLIEDGRFDVYLTDTGNDAINALICDLEDRFPPVKIRWTGAIPSDLRVRQIDLCIILSNLLRNACEAASISLLREVKADFRFAGQTLLVTIRNETSGNVTVRDGKYVESGSRSENRGIGLENVRESVRKYRGQFTIDYEPFDDRKSEEGGVFTAEIIIPEAVDSKKYSENEKEAGM